MNSNRVRSTAETKTNWDPVAKVSVKAIFRAVCQRWRSWWIAKEQADVWDRYIHLFSTCFVLAVAATCRKQSNQQSIQRDIPQRDLHTCDLEVRRSDWRNLIMKWTLMCCYPTIRFVSVIYWIYLYIIYLRLIYTCDSRFRFTDGIFAFVNGYKKTFLEAFFPLQIHAMDVTDLRLGSPIFR